MAGTARIRGGRWPLFAVVAVLAIAAVVGSVVMERRTLAASVDDRTKSMEMVGAETLAPALADVDLTKPLAAGVAASVTEKLDKVLSGATVRVRVYAKDGLLLYSTDEGDRVDSAKTGDDDAIRGAAAGATSSLIDEDRVSTRGEGAKSLGLLQVYVPLEVRGKVVGVGELDVKYKPLETASKQPWRMIQLIAGFAAALFLELALFGLARATATKRLASRSGFAAAAPVTARTEKGDAKATARDTKAQEKEAEIRQALEDQLSTLRTQMKRQEEDSTQAAREFAEQLKAAATRAEQAEVKAQASTGGADAARVATERANQLEQTLRQVEHQQQEAQARAAELEMKLAEAERRAEDAERRAEEEQSQQAAASIAGGPEDALAAAAALMRDADEGTALATLQEAAASLFPSVMSGGLKGAEVADVLVAAAAEVGLAEEEARRTIAAAFVARRSA